MNVDWNHVTRLSQAVAIVLFVLIFVLGIYLGMQIEKTKMAVSVPTVSSPAQ